MSVSPSTRLCVCVCVCLYVFPCPHLCCLLCLYFLPCVVDVSQLRSLCGNVDVNMYVCACIRLSMSFLFLHRTHTLCSRRSGMSFDAYVACELLLLHIAPPPLNTHVHQENVPVCVCTSKVGVCFSVCRDFLVTLCALCVCSCSRRCSCVSGFRCVCCNVNKGAYLSVFTSIVVCLPPPDVCVCACLFLCGVVRSHMDLCVSIVYMLCSSQKAAQVPRQEEERKFHIAYYPRDPRRRGGVLTTATQEQAAAAVATSSDVDPSLPVTARKIVRWQQGILVDDSARMSK